MPYHAVTIFSVVLLSLETVVTLLLVVHGAWMLHNYRQSAKYRSSQSNSGGGGGGNARNSVLGMPFPLLLRVLYLTASSSFVVGVIVMIAATLSFVEPGVMQDDPVHPVNKWPDLSSQGRMCILMAKFCPLNYILMKFYSYMFFFIKQRTVRQMEPKMGRLEKVVLQNTFSMFLLIGVAGWLVQGDRSDLDGTCVMWIPIYLLLFMASADCVLSSAYLYLFLQPLRATIALNAARSNRIGASVAINVAKVAPAPGGGDGGGGGEISTAQPTSPSGTSGGSGAVEAQRSGPSSPSVAPVAAAAPTTASAAANAASLSLQRVMQRNFRAVTASIISSSVNMFFLTIAILTDQPHMRKLVSPLACFDCCVMLASLGWVLHGGKSNATSSSSVASTTAAVGAGVRGDEALALSPPVAGTSSLAARPARGAHLLAPAGGSSHGPPPPQDTLHNNFLLPSSAAAAAAAASSPSSPVGAAVLGLGLAPTDAP